MRVRLWAACLLGGTRTSCAGNDTKRFGVGKLNASRPEMELGSVNGGEYGQMTEQRHDGCLVGKRTRKPGVKAIRDGPRSGTSCVVFEEM